MSDELEGWEYQTILVAGPYNQYCLVELEASGKEGWELVQINAGGVALMKRRRAVEIERLRAIVQELLAALKQLVERLKQVHADPAYLSVWTVNRIHCGPYKGPQYVKELEAASAAVAKVEGGR
jgi:hypothetical protein